jgi:hypothetical protein
MLLRFFVSNFTSFADEVEFNMFPGGIKSNKDHVYRNQKVDLLKTAAIYGANGSGKSNFIKAVHFLHDVVVKGDLSENEVKCLPFRLRKNMHDTPSIFGLECQIGKKFYEYVVHIKSDEILEETLYETKPMTKKEARLVFSRKTEGGKSKIKVDPKLLKTDKDKYRYEIYAEDLQPKQSLIFKLKDKIKEAIDVFNWFESNIWVLYPHSKFYLTLKLCTDEKYKQFLNDLLPKLGTGMNGIDIENIPFPQFFGKDDIEKQKEIESKMKDKSSLFHFFKNGREYVARRNGDDFFVNKVKTFNSDGSGNLVEFEPEEQSDGTRRILDLIPAIQMLGNKPAVFFIDEMDRSLHPSMTKELIRYFLSQATKGQLIFTTHESNLLDLEIFRQDEIWLTEKDASGATKIYPLSDFKPRYDLDIRKGYLAGRFGAIPFLGNLKDLNWSHAQK